MIATIIKLKLLKNIINLKIKLFI